jgi:hypothetical protein
MSPFRWHTSYQKKGAGQQEEGSWTTKNAPSVDRQKRHTYAKEMWKDIHSKLARTLFLSIEQIIVRWN